MLEEIIKDKVDIFLISETKLDSSFPSGQFIIKGYSTPFRLDRNQNGGGLLLYVSEDIFFFSFFCSLFFYFFCSLFYVDTNFLFTNLPIVL